MQRHVITDRGRAVSEIVVGRNMSSGLAARIPDDAHAAILCQPGTVAIADRYAAELESSGVSVTGYTLPDGEDAKRLSVVEDVYRMLNRSGYTRNDVIVGVGGGALTDVAGFVAGTFLRGIEAIYVPTTLLGAVDAAVGGKTAVNVDGKNLAGVFAHPTLVMIDVDTLDELPI